MTPADSPLLELTDENLARAIRNEAHLGGPDEFDEDALLHVLWAGVKTYFFGCCGQLAAHLARETGKPIIVLECRSEAHQDWWLRHAAIADVDYLEARRMIERGDGRDIPLIDAVGRGTFDERMDAFHLDGHAFRVVLAEDLKPDWLIACERREQILDHDPATRLSGVAVALGRPFDVRMAAGEILAATPEAELGKIPGVEDVGAWLDEPTPAL